MKFHRDPSIENLTENMLLIGDRTAQVLSLEDGSYLYGVVMTHNPYSEAKVSDTSFHKPDFSLIMTPIPVRAWSQAHRVTFTIPSSPGSLNRLTEQVNSSGLMRIRNIRTGSGLDLNSLSLYAKSVDYIEPNVVTDAEDGSNRPDDLFLSRVDMIVEPLGQDFENIAEEDVLGGLTQDGFSWTQPRKLSALHRVGKTSEEDLMASRSHLPVVVDENGASFVDLTPWMDMTLNIRKRTNRPETVADLSPYLVVGFTDTEERLSLWHFFSLKRDTKRIFFQFEIDIPADRVEHMWYARIFKILKDCDVITSRTSSRMLGGVRRVFIAASMSEEYGQANSAKLFRRLVEHDTSFHEELSTAQDMVNSLGGAPYKGSTPIFRSRLRNIKTWESHPHLKHLAFSGSPPKRNPFGFVVPFGKDEYTSWLGINDKEEQSSELGRSRLSICNEISNLVSSQSRSVSLVGPYRGGKTSMLNMVEEELREMGDQIIPIHIGMNVTEPVEMLSSVLKSMENVSFANNAKEKVEELRKALKKISSVKLGPTEVKFTEPSEIEREAILITDVVSALKSALEKIDLSDNQRFVFLVDEGLDIASWGDARALSAWRELLESRSTRKMSWLICANVPIGSLDHASPLGNVFHEINLGSFSKEECEAVIDFQFFTPASRNEEIRTDNLVQRPFISRDASNFIVTVSARMPYLFQIICYHVYDKAVRARFMVVGRQFVEIVVNEIVMSNLSDYFREEWRKLDEGTRSLLFDQVQQLRAHPSWDECIASAANQIAAEGAVRKSLLRSGLGDGEASLNPLAVMWLRSTAKLSNTH